MPAYISTNLSEPNIKMKLITYFNDNLGVTFNVINVITYNIIYLYWKTSRLSGSEYSDARLA